MKKGPLITAIVAVLAMASVLWAFTTNASPYVTVAQAKNITGDRLHLAGDIQKSTVKNDLLNHTLSFDLIDEKGDRITVIHKGEPPSNMGEATKVVAIGKVEGAEFHSSKLLVKCPSKYEGEDKAPTL